MVAIFTLVDSIGLFVRQNPGLLWLAIILSFVFLITLVCCSSVARTYPTNYIVLSLFTLCEGYLLGAVSSTYETNTVFYSVLMTLSVTLGLMLFAQQTKYDFTGYGGYMLAILIVFIVFGLIAPFFCSSQSSCSILSLIYSLIGALIFSMYIVYDTQLILGGKHKYQFDINDHVFAALSLYLDIINLFLFILSMFGGSDRR